MRYNATIGDRDFVIDVNHEGEIQVDGVTRSVDIRAIDPPRLYSLIVDGMSCDVYVEEQNGSYRLVMWDGLFEVNVQDERMHRLADRQRNPAVSSGEVLIKAPMPGIVVDIPVSQGQQVERDEVVAVLESMKMQNEFRAPRAGTVRSVRVRQGDKVDHGQLMLTIS
ncbi:MAG: biotin/lipoyl-binding protein [Ardenticatenia bacterium]|nr:biotin/lipoyl-binding protein [Ardenticatenia bacterium]